MIQTWENFVTDGRTDRQRQSEESDFMGRCQTNVERPKNRYHINKYHKIHISRIISITL